ncbi:MAG TPA: DUF2062 domain-containing protein [Candidatus Sumerlaeota bacterium]|nr:DUF2062 domain-containing protein [Candidatus Sumerlaeota bacterium]HPS01694.1 DUF2062 domain-containing protein [Candidatus Sumerlaeota bacterium]
MRALVVLPTYNNRSTLRRVAEQALATRLPVLVVNDGSTDGGPATLDGLQVERLDFARNRGKGAAIRAGAQWADGHGFSHIVTVDADGQHDPAEIPRLLEAARRDPGSIILGMRDFVHSAAPDSSRFGRAFSNFWVRVCSGHRVGDSQSGFRVYPVEVLEKLRCRSERYNFEIEVLVRGLWAGLRVVDVAISVRYFAGDERVSHFRPWVDNARISWTYAGLCVRHFVPWPHRRLFNLRGDEVNPSLRHPFASLARLHRRLIGEQRDLSALSLRHPIRSLRLLHLERAAPHQVALAAMLGVFLGTLPLIACHTIVIVFFATRLRLNRMVAFYASNLCMPPLVPALAIEAGYFLRYGRFLTGADLHSTEAVFQTLVREMHLRLWEYLLGSLVVGPALALAVGAGVYTTAVLYRRRRGKLPPQPDGMESPPHDR